MDSLGLLCASLPVRGPFFSVSLYYSTRGARLPLPSFRLGVSDGSCGSSWALTHRSLCASFRALLHLLGLEVCPSCGGLPVGRPPSFIALLGAHRRTSPRGCPCSYPFGSLAPFSRASSSHSLLQLSSLSGGPFVPPIRVCGNSLPLLHPCLLCPFLSPSSYALLHTRV